MCNNPLFDESTFRALFYFFQELLVDVYKRQGYSSFRTSVSVVYISRCPHPSQSAGGRISDVYKRQVLACGVNGETYDLGRPINEDANFVLYKWDDEEGKPVSYTHLDVYKRQSNGR